MHCTYSNAEVGETKEITRDSINASSNFRDVLYRLFEGGTGRLERMEIKESGQSWTCNPGALTGSIRDSPDFKSSTTLVNSQFKFASVQLGLYLVLSHFFQLFSRPHSTVLVS